ncbi:hypothetical protein MLD38_006606 [Melastoma candidum]|uniref:Uncharacterized protein n=1 Tax=Melastoma candidum TaxID=119954 RepID=A0ACB9RND9_9MYRT|nr:hypothetical protein MLD38_006606 [Melastoma candidum]
MRFNRGGSAGGDEGNRELQTAVVSYRKKFPLSLLWPFLQGFSEVGFFGCSRHRGFNILGCIQRQRARILALDFQLDWLDYQSENWYHADLDFETFSFSSFFTFVRDMTLRSTKALIQLASVPNDLGPPVDHGVVHRQCEHKINSNPPLRKMAEVSGWQLNWYQSLVLLIFSSVLVIGLWFQELFFGTAVSWASQVTTEVALYLDNLQAM